jgi:tRNA-binding protein
VGAAEELERLELVVGRVASVEDHPGARGRSYLLTLELGPRGRREATLPASGYERGDLLGRQVVCVLDDDAVLVLGAHSHATGVVLLRPDREVEDGTPVA